MNSPSLRAVPGFQVSRIPAHRLLALAAIVVPRFISSDEGGLAAAETGVLIFLVFLVAGFIVATAAMVIAIRAYSSLSWLTRAAGIGPSVVLGGAIFLVVYYLRY
jgi:glycerol-3-phosphate acyltransferase PlsY